MCTYELEIEDYELELEDECIDSNFVCCLECGLEFYVPDHNGEAWMCNDCLRTW